MVCSTCLQFALSISKDSEQKHQTCRSYGQICQANSHKLDLSTSYEVIPHLFVTRETELISEHDTDNNS